LYCPVGTYDLPSGGHAFMLVLDRQWPHLVEALGRPDLLDDPRYATSQARAENQATLIPLVQDWMLSFPDDDALLDVCLEHRVPIGKVLDPLDAVGHPHYEARGMVRRVNDPVLGEMLMPGNPFRFSAQPESLDLVAPLLGQHNREVLSGILGYDDATIDALESGGVLHSSPC
jgi:formyl-CoA transferase